MSLSLPLRIRILSCVLYIFFSYYYFGERWSLGYYLRSSFRGWIQSSIYWRYSRYHIEIPRCLLMIINERSRIKCKLDRDNLNWNEWPVTVKQFNRIWLYIYIPKLISNILYITFDPLSILYQLSRRKDAIKKGITKFHESSYHKWKFL